MVLLYKSVHTYAQENQQNIYNRKTHTHNIYTEYIYI